MLDIRRIREEFPILHQKIQGKPLIYFDNAATSQKPRRVIEMLNSYYTGFNSNVHRGAHTLAQKATAAFEDSRETVRAFINAGSLEEIIFTKGTTEGINLVAASYGRTFVKAGEEVIISTLEHHSNIVPWQLLCEQTGAKLRVIPINEAGELDMEAYKNMLSEKTAMVAVNHISNALGTINPVKEMTETAHAVGAVILIDGAQATPHQEVDVQAIGCDFYAFSGHKVYGPTGIGALYGKKELLEKMPPYSSGGEMIKEVTFEKTTFNDLPFKFEAGTPNIADAAALKYALDFVTETGRAAIAAHEDKLLQRATAALQNIDNLRIIGTAAKKAGVISFVVEGAHTYDIGMLLDANGIAVRTGNHCTQPLMKRFGIEGTVRASFAVYNTEEEVDIFVSELKRSLSRL